MKVRTSLIEELVPNNQPDDPDHGKKPRFEVCQEPLLHHFSASFSVWNQNRQEGACAALFAVLVENVKVPGQVRERTGPALIHNQLVDRSLQTNVCDESCVL